jgi:hypothetical protein
MRWSVRKFPEWWYCTVMVGHGASFRVGSLRPPPPSLSLCCSIHPGFGGSTVGPIFGAKNSQNLLGVRSGDCGGWVMTQHAMCGSVRYRDAETTVPACHLLRLSPICVGQTLKNLHVELTNTSLRCTKPSMSIPGTF